MLWSGARGATARLADVAQLPLTTAFLLEYDMWALALLYGDLALIISVSFSLWALSMYSFLIGCMCACSYVGCVFIYNYLHKNIPPILVKMVKNKPYHYIWYFTIQELMVRFNI